MSIADQIIEQGPFPPGETFTVHCSPAEINELRAELITGRGVSRYEEWRVTGTWTGQLLEKTFLPDDGYSQPETDARAFIARQANDPNWTDGPHLHKRTVTVTDWEDA